MLCRQKDTTNMVIGASPILTKMVECLILSVVFCHTKRVGKVAGYRIDVAKLIDGLGGARAVSEGIIKYNLRPITEVAVMRWRQRNSIPCHRLADILMLAKRIRKPVNIMDVITAPKGARGD